MLMLGFMGLPFEVERVAIEVAFATVDQSAHLGLAKDTPASRPTAIRSRAESKIQSLPRLGGLHHRYAIAA